MEPGNRNCDSAGTTTSTGEVADVGIAVGGTESLARAGDSVSRESESVAKQSESGGTSSKTRVASIESGARTSDSGATGSGSGVKMLAMLQAIGAVIVTNEQRPGCTDEQAATAVAQL